MSFIKRFIHEIVDEKFRDIWFHGSPDSSELLKTGAFENRIIEIDYVNDLDGFNKINEKLKISRDAGNNELYFRLLDEIPRFKSKFRFVAPVFLTNNIAVAKTYADPRRAFDYQKAQEKVISVKVNCSNRVVIDATGLSFKMIPVDKIVNGFVNSGLDEENIDELIKKFNYHARGNVVKTDVIAAIASWLGFDCVDVIGVLDSYNVGKIKSTVRMVLKPSIIEILN